MKLMYFSDTDTLYIDLANRPSVESEVINDNLIIDRDAAGQAVGITIEHYSQTATSKVIEMLVPQDLLTA